MFELEESAMGPNGDGHPNGNAEALAFWEPRDNDGEPEMLVFGTGERIAVTDRVFQGESGALLLKWKREADAAVREAARRQAECEANVQRLEAARLLDNGVAAWRAQTGGKGLQ
jgi:hypothetical protein